MAHDISVGETDLRTTPEQFRHLQDIVLRARLSEEWHIWQQLLSPEAAAQAIYAIASESQEVFKTIDDWLGRRHTELARLIQQTIHCENLNTLRTAEYLTARGAPLGKQYQENPLRGALAVNKNGDAGNFLTVPLALLVTALQGQHARQVPLSWLESICGAAHNHGKADWTAFLSRCLGAPSRSWSESVRWAANFKPPEGVLRPVESEFCLALKGLGKLLSKESQPVSRRVQTPPPTPIQHLVDSEDSNDISQPELADHHAESIYTPTRESLSEADEPEITIVTSASPTPASEPDSCEEVQRAETIRGAFRSAVDNQHLQCHWDSLLPNEIHALIQTIERDLPSSEPAVAIPAMISSLAVCLGKPPQKISSLLIAAPGALGLDTKNGVYNKIVPRPPYSWQPDVNRPIRIQTSAHLIECALPYSLAQALHKWLGGNETGITIEQALKVGSDQLKRWLRDWLTEAREGKHRLTSRRISRILEIETYARTQRALVAYWISGTSETTPPSNAYYTAAPVAEIQAHHRAAIEQLWKGAGCEANLPVGSPAATGFIGSRLIPFDDDVRTLAGYLGSRIPSPAKLTDWPAVCEFHNRFTAWVVEFLYFATAHRPVEDPFDDHASISLKLRSLLIGDKIFGQSEERRLVPLCDSACRQLELYLAHLEGLYALIPARFEQLRSEIQSQLANRRARILPLFFFLDPEGNWYSVSPTTHIQHFPEQWNFPDNFHRHLLACWFYRKGISEDACAQMMGHDDVGTSALSPLSPCSPEELLGPLRKELDAFLAHFGWSPRIGLPAPSTQGTPNEFASRKKSSVTFGTARRALERKAQEDADRADVASLVQQQLDGRQEDQLAQGDVGALIESVQNLGSNQSTRRAMLRMDALRIHLLRIRKEHGLKIKIPPFKRIVNRGESLFLARCLVDAELGLQLRTAFLGNLKRLGIQLSPSKQPILRAAYALFALIVFGRVLDENILDRLLDGAPFQLVADDAEMFFIEFECGKQNIRRYPVGTLVAALMQSTRFEKPARKEIIHALERLIATLTGRDRRRHYNSLSRLREVTLNLARLELPGSSVAFLSGESGAVSLPRHDWLRLLTDEEPIPAKLPSTAPIESLTDSDNLAEDEISELAGILQTPLPGTARSQALAFIKGVDEKIRETWGRTAKKQGKTRALNTAPVAQLAPKISALIKEFQKNGGLPPIAQMLGEWLIRLCSKGSARGKVVASTIITYWSTLKYALVELGYSYTLNDLLGSGLEEVYGQVLEQSEVEAPHLVLTRLILFHAFVQTHFGAADVDWSEVVPEGFPRGEMKIDAGFITLSEYRTALALLAEDSSTPDRRERTFNCAGLILFYRFGARAGEISGLRQMDIQGEEIDLILRICNSDFRRIKSDAGVRHVPLMGSLSAFEKQTLNDWRDHIKHCHPDDRLAGLFGDRDKGRILVDTRRMMARIGDALVAATGNPAARPHYCRHTFASRLLYLAQGNIDCPDSIKNAKFIKKSEIGKLLRCAFPNTRRLPWLVGSLIGHAHPGTTARFYNHLNDLLLAQRPDAVLQPSVDDHLLEILLGVDGQTIRQYRRNRDGQIGCNSIVMEHGKIERTSDLVRPRSKSKLPARAIANKEKPTSLETTARILQAASRGARLECIANRLLIDSTRVFQLLKRVESICEETAFVRTKNDDGTRIPDPSRLSNNEWRRLISAAEALDMQSEKVSITLMQAGEIWQRGYAQIGNHLLIRTVDDLLVITQLLTSLGMPSDQFEILIDRQTREDDWCIELTTKIKDLKFNIFAIDRLPQMISGPRAPDIRRRRAALSVKESNAGLVRSQKATHFLLLIVACSAVEYQISDKK